MKKTTFTKIASLWMMLAMLTILATFLTVGASAEGTVQAQWGASAEGELTGSGTLQEALDAAAAENSTVGYIKVVTDVDLGSETLDAIGGSFTLDLNGKTVTSSTFTLYLRNSVHITIADGGEGGKLETTGAGYPAVTMLDTSAVELTVAGGTVKSENAAIALYSSGNATSASLTVTGGTLIGHYAINAFGASVTVTGGDLQGGFTDIYWVTGTLDLSAHPNPAGITVYNATGEEQALTLGNGFHWYDATGAKVTALADTTNYTVDATKYAVGITDNDEWDIANYSITPDIALIAPGKAVTVTVELEGDYFTATLADASGAFEITDNGDGTYTFVMPEADVSLTLNVKYNAFKWNSGEAEADWTWGDVYDLVKAINAGTAPSVRFVGNTTVFLNRGELPAITGKALLNITDVWLYLYTDSQNDLCATLTLGEGADITLYAEGDVRNTDWSSVGYVEAFFELQSGSKLTIDGADAWIDVFYYGGALDISGAHWDTSLEIFNCTETEVAVDEFITYGARFRAIDYVAWYDPSYAGYKIPTVTKFPVWDGEAEGGWIASVFTLTFDLGVGSGTMESIEVLYDYGSVSIPHPQNVSHPEGLSFVGWSYKVGEYSGRVLDYFTLETLSDVTLTAEWSAPLYVGGVAMNDGDYLSSGATETSKQKPALGGYAYYQDGVLTLNNYTFSGDGYLFAYKNGDVDGNRYALIYTTRDLIIELVGNSTLTGTAGDYGYLADTDGIYVFGALTVRGEGSLQIYAEDDGIYVEDLTIESGKLTVDCDDEAIEAKNVTVLGGVLNVYSDDGIDADTVYVKGGELRVVSNSGSIELATTTLTVEGGYLYVEGGAIEADYVTISGGVVEVKNAYGCAITNSDGYDDEASYAVLNITGGKVILTADDHVISFGGNITVSGADLTIYGKEEDGFVGILFWNGDLTVTDSTLSIKAFFGIYVWEGCNVTVANSELSIYANYGIYAMNGNVTMTDSKVNVETYNREDLAMVGICVFGHGDVTVTGGELSMIAYYGIYTDNGNVTLDNAKAIICTDYSCICDMLTVKGTKTVFYAIGELDVNEFSVNEEELNELFNDGSVVFYEGVEITHTWSEDYNSNGEYHWHVCTDADCGLKRLQDLLGMPEEYLFELYFIFEESAVGEHSVTEGEESCSVCGYPDNVSDDTDTVPEDALLMVGEDIYLTDGQYLTNAGEILDQKPVEGGYLYVTADLNTGMGTVVFHNFNMTLAGVGILPNGSIPTWEIVLEGTNVMTVTHSDLFDGYSGEMGEIYSQFNGTGIVVLGCQLAIRGQGNLTVNATTGIFSETDILISDHATVTLNATETGISAQQFFAIENGASVTVNFDRNGIELTNGTLSICYASLTVNAGKTAIELTSSSWLYVYADSTVNILGATKGIYGSDGGILTVEGILNVNADLAGISGALTLEVFGYDFNITVRAARAIDVYCFTDNNFVYYSNAYPDYYYDEFNDEYAITYYYDVIFRNEDLTPASYVSMKGETVMEADTQKAVEKLEQLLAEDGSIAEIAGVINELDRLAETLTNAEGEGRIDLLEKANEAMTAALATIEEKLTKAQEELSDAIAKGEELDGKIANLNEAIQGVKSTYATTDAMTDAVSAAQTTLDTAIKAVDKKVDDAKAELEAAIKAGNETLTAEIETLNKALDDAEAAYAAADKAIDDKLTAAQTTLDTAIKAVDKKVDDAKAELEAAIKAGNETLTAEIETLNKALDDAEAAYAAADKEIDDKLTAAKTTLARAEQKLAVAESTIAELQRAQDALKAELDALKNEVNDDAEEKPSGLQTATTVMAITGVVGNAGLIAAWIYIKKFRNGVI